SFVVEVGQSNDSQEFCRSQRKPRVVTIVSTCTMGAMPQTPVRWEALRWKWCRPRNIINVFCEIS
ncbi:hypothetical protein PENTCL1PPCAC_30590, partial [Pristionchus entomophagus]